MCKKLKKMLDDKGIRYEYYDVNLHDVSKYLQYLREGVDRFGFIKLPVVLVFKDSELVLKSMGEVRSVVKKIEELSIEK